MGNKIVEPLKIFTFYTEDSPYQEIAQRYLMASLNSFPSIKLKILKAHNYHHWGKNVAQKPYIIHNLLDEGETDFIFLDADATVERYPELFHNIPEEYDIACHILDWDTWYKNKSHVKELLSGTMFFRNNDKVKSLCREWYAKAEDGSGWEQTILEDILKKRKDIKIYELPIEYCHIATLPNGSKPHVQCKNIVIQHHQVSRNLKRRGKL